MSEVICPRNNWKVQRKRDRDETRVLEARRAEEADVKKVATAPMPVTLGNLIGGTAFVAAVYWLLLPSIADRAARHPSVHVYGRRRGGG